MANEDNANAYEYDGAEFMKVIEDQRNSALTQAAQLTAVVSRLMEDKRTLQKQLDDLRGQDIVKGESS